MLRQGPQLLPAQQAEVVGQGAACHVNQKDAAHPRAVPWAMPVINYKFVDLGASVCNSLPLERLAHVWVRLQFVGHLYGKGKDLLKSSSVLFCSILNL